MDNKLRVINKSGLEIIESLLEKYRAELKEKGNEKFHILNKLPALRDYYFVYGRVRGLEEIEMWLKELNYYFGVPWSKAKYSNWKDFKRHLEYVRDLEKSDNEFHSDKKKCWELRELTVDFLFDYDFVKGRTLAIQQAINLFEYKIGNKEIEIQIDGTKHKVCEQRMSGKEILELVGKKYENWDLNCKLNNTRGRGGFRQKIQEIYLVDMDDPEIERFETVKLQVTNGEITCS